MLFVEPAPATKWNGGNSNTFSNNFRNNDENNQPNGQASRGFPSRGSFRTGNDGNSRGETFRFVDLMNLFSVLFSIKDVTIAIKLDIRVVIVPNHERIRVRIVAVFIRVQVIVVVFDREIMMVKRNRPLEVGEEAHKPMIRIKQRENQHSRRISVHEAVFRMAQELFEVDVVVVNRDLVILVNRKKHVSELN